MKDGMKKPRTISVDDVFNMLLFGLPQGMLLGVVWLAYTVWNKLAML
jgi:hypothetical protein